MATSNFECARYIDRRTAGLLRKKAPLNCPNAAECDGTTCSRFGESQPTNITPDAEDREQDRVLAELTVADVILHIRNS
jgi:hypothetical protein